MHLPKHIFTMQSLDRLHEKKDILNTQWIQMSKGDYDKKKMEKRCDDQVARRILFTVRRKGDEKWIEKLVPKKHLKFIGFYLIRLNVSAPM